MMIISGFTRLFKDHLPLLLVVAVALIIARQNIDTTTIYSGWDNIHAEFDLARYARQVFFGAWVEHQGLGAPAAQAQLAEIPRLPILLLLHTLLPANLIRYVFIFLMYLIGGVGMYWYLATIWLKQNKTSFKTWLAALGGLFYLLHVLTLQQFYISFEMFMTQFAFLPFLLVIIHRLAKQINSKNILLFVLLQLLLAPSSHTSTVFYLAVLFSLVYGFFLIVKENPLKALRFSILLGLLTLLAHAYWILPNLYYTLNNASYVAGSRTNQLFAPESVWSVREAGTLSNLTSGTHYLFSWRDYDFATQQFEFIFDEWLPHLNQWSVKIMLQILGVFTMIGGLLLIKAKNKGWQRFSILIIYLFCLSFIWIDLLPSNKLIDQLYQSGSFREAFRNPFTKLSIIYSFVSVLLFIQLAESLVNYFKRNGRKHFPGKFVAIGLLGALAGMMIYISWPSFQGHFISEKLKIEYPAEYQAMFNYLSDQDPHLRILQLPQFSHASWEYYTWPWLGEGNGYQGMGFYFFGFPQAFLNRDADRWVATSDSFYHELKHALDRQNATHFGEILAKYRVDLLIIDETRLDPNREHTYLVDHRLAREAGLTEVWRENFLTIYQRQSETADQEIFAPKQLTKTSVATERVRTDYLYREQGDYLTTGETEATVIYPLADLVVHQLNGLDFTDDGLRMIRPLTDGKYTLTVPGWQEKYYFTPVAIRYQQQTVTVSFPRVEIQVEGKTITLPRLADFEFEVVPDLTAIMLFFNEGGAIVEQNQSAFPILKVPVGESVKIELIEFPGELVYLPSGEVDVTGLTVNPVARLNVDWSAFTSAQTLSVDQAHELKIISRFPSLTVDLLKNPTVNCATGKQGSILTQSQKNTVLFQADDFGVNCGGYAFEHLSSAYPYVMELKGKNYQGRGIKFFISYTDRAIVPEDYLIQENEYVAYIGLGKISDDPRDIFYLNWETRSFGKEDINELESISLAPFPLEQLAGLKLEKLETPLQFENRAEILQDRVYLDSIHLIKADCPEEACWVALDQSFDDLWLAFRVGKADFLPHHRYNNWANIWQLDKTGTIVIFYLPELVSLLSMVGLASWLIILLLKNSRR
ncbi:MAG: hypothetical protein A2411_00215 [Candidatus Pacebacteria bacterium RIFOXYC1_FULL_39_21]|nr:MAG: hypothetical protein A2411_00215 [Candidatus Pacebacteria bacterium RIFOXYC1_FULL_39_21]